MRNVLDREAIKTIKNFLFDCDGVIWKQNNLISGSKELLSILKAKDKRIFLVSNNSTMSVENYINKCNELGLNVDSNEIICSSNIMANYMKSLIFKGKAYIVGEEGLSRELNKVGIDNIGVGEENRFFRSLGDETDFLDNDVKAVVVGFDRFFNITKLTIATTYILKRGCLFFATNTDAVFPSQKYPIPGTGSIVKAISFATSTEPIVTGKPYSPMFKVLQEQYDLKAEESIMIGDNLDTDITFGNDHNMKTLLVLTGVTSRDDLLKVDADSVRYPTFITDSVADLVDIFESS